MYPSDIDPDSRCRLPLPKRDDLDADARTLFDAAVGKNTQMLAGLRGPIGIKLHSPEFAKLSIPSVRYLRFGAGLSHRIREVAILITAHCCDCEFEWTMHQVEALKEGVPADTIEAIEHGQPIDALDPVDGMVITLGRQIFETRRVSSETYALCLKQFGPRKLVDLVALMGNYAATAALLIAFDVQIPR